MSPDVVVVGAGTVGASIAYGLAGRGARTLLIDGGDTDHRAATANFGLVWAQGKGMDMPSYQRLTKDSVDLWPEFNSELQDLSHIDMQLEQNGGLTLCNGEQEFEARRTKLERLQLQLSSNSIDWEMVERPALERLLPGVTLGRDVVGASFGQRDGHINPLKLLTALHRGFALRGGEFRGAGRVNLIRPLRTGTFELHIGGEQILTEKLVIAAGLGSRTLAEQVGISLPTRPQRGQILVTERLQSFLPLPLHSIRQTREGTVMIGATHEEVGDDSSTTIKGAAGLAQKAIRQFPDLARVRLVRQWAGLRIMTPDGYPLYLQAEGRPGAFVTTCHSGVTLAPTHATVLADAILDGRVPSPLAPFNLERFDVPQAA